MLFITWQIYINYHKNLSKRLKVYKINCKILYLNVTNKNLWIPLDKYNKYIQHKSLKLLKYQLNNKSDIKILSYLSINNIIILIFREYKRLRK